MEKPNEISREPLSTEQWEDLKNKLELEKNDVLRIKLLEDKLIKFEELLASIKLDISESALYQGEEDNRFSNGCFRNIPSQLFSFRTRESKSQFEIFRTRRKEDSRFTMEITPETQHHFYDYIIKRAPLAYEFSLILRKIPVDCEKSVFEEILQRVIACIEEAAEAREKMAKARYECKKQNFRLESERIAEHIRNNSRNFWDFTRVILKTYTMETFLYSYLNELLRSEVWEEINILAPFLGCLLYAFEDSGSLMQLKKPEEIEKSLLATFPEQELCLYRGTALTKELLDRYLELYDTNHGGHFTWKGITSTSRSEEVGRNFIHFSWDGDEDKVRVFFVIKLKCASNKDLEGVIDVSTTSKYPHEQEVLLAPGLVFELQSVQTKNNVYRITVRVKRVFDKAVQVGAMPILDRNKLISQELLLQICLKLCSLLKENKLIQSLEIKDRMRRKIRKVETTPEEKTKDSKLYGQFKPLCLGTIFRNLL